MNGEKIQVDSQVIKKIRDRLNLSQEGMAELLQTDRARLSKIERGLETPDWLVKFAALSELLHRSGLSWHDVILDLPDNLGVSEKPEDYKV